MINNKWYNRIKFICQYILEPLIIIIGSLLSFDVLSQQNIMKHIFIINQIPQSSTSIIYSISTFIFVELISFINKQYYKKMIHVFVRITANKNDCNIIKSHETIDTKEIRNGSSSISDIYLLIKVNGKLCLKRKNLLVITFPRYVKASSGKAQNHYSNKRNQLYFKIPNHGINSATISLMPNYSNNTNYADDDITSKLDTSLYSSFFIRPQHLGKLNLKLN